MTHFSYRLSSQPSAVIGALERAVRVVVTPEMLTDH
jgi:hypothetical protein